MNDHHGEIHQQRMLSHNLPRYNRTTRHYIAHRKHSNSNPHPRPCLIPSLLHKTPISRPAPLPPHPQSTSTIHNPQSNSPQNRSATLLRPPRAVEKRWRALLPPALPPLAQTWYCSLRTQCVVSMLGVCCFHATSVVFPRQNAASMLLFPLPCPPHAQIWCCSLI